MNAYVNSAFRNGSASNFRSSSNLKKFMANNSSIMRNRNQNSI